MPNAASSNQIKTYSLANHVPGTTGTGLDQFVDYIYADNGLAGATDGRDITKGASVANSLNLLILEAANATGAAADGRKPAFIWFKTMDQPRNTAATTW